MRPRPGLEALAAELAARGVDVLVAGATRPGAIALPTLAGARRARSRSARRQSFYRLSATLSPSQRGCDPDRPPHLRKVTETI